MSHHILEIEDLGLDFDEKAGKQVVLNHLNLVQKKGEWLALIGPHGAGKTSLGLVIKGLLTPTRGSLHMFSRCPEDDLQQRKQKVGLLFSNPRDQICALTVQGDIAFGLFQLGLTKKESKKRVDEAMHILGISHLAHQMTHSISGGEQQKVALAGLVALKPEYIVLDEPATFLSSRGRDELLHLIKSLHDNGMSILYIASTWEEISKADRVAVLQEGRISWSASPHCLAREERILEATGHCPPDIMRLVKKLRECGLDLPDHIQNADQLLDILLRRFQGEKN